jgi:hypothetical protein
VDAFLDNAQRILDVAKTGAGPDDRFEEFALVIRPDGGLHFIMECPVSLEAASVYAGAQSAYRVTRSRHGIRVEGKSFGQRCVLEQRNIRSELFRDQALYLTGAPAS